MMKSIHSLDTWRRGLSFTQQLGCIVGLGLALRVIWGLLVPVIPVSDSTVYWMTAENLALHGVYGVIPEDPFSYWPVGTSGVYAFMFKLFGVSTFPIVLINIIVGCLLIYTSASLARRWMGDTVALWTAVILAVWPTLILYTTVMASEVFFALAVNLGLLSWRMRRFPLLLSAFVSGVFFGGAALIRPAALLIPIVFAVLSAIRDRNWLPQATILGAVLVGMTLTIAPWTMRNIDVHDEFVLISTNGGPVMWMGNNPESTGVYMQLPEYVAGMNEVERAKVLQAEAKQYMLENPVRTISLFVKKVIDTHIRETIGVHWNTEGIKKTFGPQTITPFKILTQSYWLLILFISLIGVSGVLTHALTRTDTLLDKATALLSPPLIIWAYYAGIHGLILAQDRYHLQSAPFIAMFAASGGIWLTSQSSKVTALLAGNPPKR